MLPRNQYYNIVPYSKMVNFDDKEGNNFIAVIRQCFHNTLKDRFLQAPYLSDFDKHYILM
jgi:hypothetical protein